MQIVNPGNEDYHIHSLNYSDGMSTIDEIVKYAGEIGLIKIAITDHCQAHLDKKLFGNNFYYSMVTRWKNVHNNVIVHFGVEADILNENGDVCMDIQGITPDLILLSTHPAPVYMGDPKKITDAYVNAIERYHEKISFISHPCSKYFEDFINIDTVTALCNKYEIPMEFNCANFVYNRTNIINLKKMLSKVNRIYINSDAHTLNELKELREIGLKYLMENNIL